MAKRKAVKKVQEDTSVYECKLCRDKKVVERNGTMQKCLCVIQKEVKEYLSVFPDNTPVDKKMIISKIDRNMLFEGIDVKIFQKRAKSFMFKQFFKDEHPNYMFMSVNEYTSYYVVGDADDIIYVPYLFLTMGRDNYNVSQLTTITTLLTTRLEIGRKTWVYIYPNVTKSKLVEYYGREFYELAFETNSFVRTKK